MVPRGFMPPQQLAKRSTISRPSRRRVLKNLHGDTEKALFACPFYKHRPNLHEDCQHYVLKRIKDVRQHISRRHKNTDQLEYKSPNPLALLDIRQVGIQARGTLPDHGKLKVSQQQWDSITQQAVENKTKSPKEQWIGIWEILFPGIPPPRSVSLSNENSFHKFQTLLRRFWASNCCDIINKTGIYPYLENSLGLSLGAFDRVVDCLLSQFEADMVRPASTGDTQVNIPCQAPLAIWNNAYSTTSTTTAGLFLSDRQSREGSPRLIYDPISVGSGNERKQTCEPSSPWLSDQGVSLTQSAYLSTTPLANTAMSQLSFSDPSILSGMYPDKLVSGEIPLSYELHESRITSEMNLAAQTGSATEGYDHGNLQNSVSWHAWPGHAAALTEWHWNGACLNDDNAYPR